MVDTEWCQQGQSGWLTVPRGGVRSTVRWEGKDNSFYEKGLVQSGVNREKTHQGKQDTRLLGVKKISMESFEREKPVSRRSEVPMGREICIGEGRKS